MVRGHYHQTSCPFSHTTLILHYNLAEPSLEPRYLVYNLSEVALEELLPGSCGHLITHSLRHLRRVYPRATRVTSTNFVPLEHWRSGTCVNNSEYPLLPRPLSRNADFSIKLAAVRSWLTIQPGHVRG